MQVTLTQFEAINELHQSLIRMGDFMTCADPRGYVQTSNRLLDECIDTLGYDHVRTFPSAEACAADFVARAMLSADMVEDAA